jgi:hypothetical protein
MSAVPPLCRERIAAVCALVGIVFLASRCRSFALLAALIGLVATLWPTTEEGYEEIETEGRERKRRPTTTTGSATPMQQEEGYYYAPPPSACFRRAAAACARPPPSVAEPIAAPPVCPAPSPPPVPAPVLPTTYPVPVLPPSCPAPTMCKRASCCGGGGCGGNGGGPRTCGAAAAAGPAVETDAAGHYIAEHSGHPSQRRYVSAPSCAFTCPGGTTAAAPTGTMHRLARVEPVKCLPPYKDTTGRPSRCNYLR